MQRLGPDAGAGAVVGGVRVATRAPRKVGVTPTAGGGSNVPANRFGVMFMCGDLTPGPPMGDGLLCSSGSGGYRRLGAQHSGSFGFFDKGSLVELTGDLFGPDGTISQGSTWVFQMWYRDEVGPCGTGFNTTNAYSVTFTP